MDGADASYMCCGLEISISNVVKAAYRKFRGDGVKSITFISSAIPVFKVNVGKAHKQLDLAWRILKKNHKIIKVKIM